MGEQTIARQLDAEIVLDMRPDLENGGEPFVRVMEAALAMRSDQTLLIIAPFEPVPLYDALSARGFSHETIKVAADEWVVRFCARQP